MQPRLKWLTESVAYIPAPVNTGVLVHEAKGILVDTGLDKDHANKMIRALEAENITPVAIINTHSHADHCGGNAQLQQKRDLPVFAPRLEKPFIEDPYLEAFGLFGAAHPPAALQNKFLKATPSRVTGVFEPDDSIWHWQDFQITLVPLPGHSPQQTGILCEGVLFAADVLLGAEYLDKHLIPFNSDVVRHRESLLRLRDLVVDWCVPGHGIPMEDHRPAVERNLAALDLIDDWILTNTQTQATLDELLCHFCSHHGVGMETISQYHLYRTAFAAHASGLTEMGKLCHRVQGGKLFWEAAFSKN
ncbi:MBL fold metallo-hydrolase [Anoxynatronum sibiricum]|uniref:MBL fold metallo-hydrolase n=1 Tax=Anoxynatronum sibiricum TaxID=210623 RepID=A0ABU9VVS7_9CLOT